MGVGDVLALLLQPDEQLADILGLQPGLADDGHRHVGDAADGVEILQDVVLQVVVERWRGGLADVPDGQRVAVGRRLGDAGHADGAAGAADVFHDDLLAQRAAHGLADQSRHRIGRAAGASRHDDGDGTIGVGLGSRVTGANGETSRHCRSKPQQVRNRCHGVLSL
jgi:hypothetical protein